MTGGKPFRIRWLGRVRYRDALALQRGLFAHCADDHLLLLEHHPVYTLGSNAGTEHLLAPPEEVGAELEHTDRGGDITFHGPGQLVGYPLLHLAGGPGGLTGSVAHVRSVEDVVIDVCRDLGLGDVGRLDRYPGVWVRPDGPDPRKVAAIGVRMSRGRTMHGFALNVDPDLSFFDRMVPCGISEHGVTSLAAEGIEVTMREVVDRVAERAAERWARGPVDRADVAWRHRSVDLAAFSRGEGPGEPPPVERKPDWMKVRLDTGPGYRRLKGLLRERSLVTVCEEAGCPNVFDCWNDGTATFMINGERCTRACGFCLVDTRRPEGLDAGEPARVADAVAEMGLAHAVVTAVARDDLPDGGAAAFAATIAAVRDRNPGTAVEVLIPDCKGDPGALDVVFDARPDVLNHNLETVPGLYLEVRPGARYFHSLRLLQRVKELDPSIFTKSGIMVGLGEQAPQVKQVMDDMRAADVDFLTIGQYLQPTPKHHAVDRFVTPEEFKSYEKAAYGKGFLMVSATPLTRSSYHAGDDFAQLRAARNAKLGLA